jgi:hypothetical protein
MNEVMSYDSRIGGRASTSIGELTKTTTFLPVLFFGFDDDCPMISQYKTK